jgi:hypothetical protein
MGLYMYCIGKASHPAPTGVAGIDGAVVRAEEVAGFAVWVSDLDAPPAPSLDDARLHNAVIEAAAVDATPLPFRFGQWFDSPRDMARSLVDRQELLASQLLRVEGALEYGVRVMDPAYKDQPRDRGSGKAYIESLARRSRGDDADHSRGREIAAALRSRLGPLVRDERVRLVGSGTLASIAHLVDRHDTGTYLQAVRKFPAEHPDLRFVFTGPWPPYGFVDE